MINVDRLEAVHSVLGLNLFILFQFTVFNHVGSD